MALTDWRSRSVQIGLSSSSWKKVRQRILILAVSNEWFRRPLNRIRPMIALQRAAPDDRDEIDHGAEHFAFRGSSTPWSLSRAQTTNLILRGHQMDLVILRRHD